MAVTARLRSLAVCCQVSRGEKRGAFGDRFQQDHEDVIAQRRSHQNMAIQYNKGELFSHPNCWPSCGIIQHSPWYVVLNMEQSYKGLGSGN